MTTFTQIEKLKNKAIRLMEKGKYDLAIEALNEAIVLNGKSDTDECIAECYYCRGEIYRKHKKNYKAAILDFKKSIKYCGKSKSCGGCAKCCIQIVRAYRVMGDMHNAVKYGKEFIERIKIMKQEEKSNNPTTKSANPVNLKNRVNRGSRQKEQQKCII